MASHDVTIIGKEARVRGRITGAAALEIHGFVEGEVTLDGDLTVGETGLVASDVSGRRVVVRGAVKGDVTGGESVHLEEGAKVVGDVKAPRVAIAAGALCRGHVQTGSSPHGASRPRAVPAARGSSSNVAKAAKPTAARPALISGGANSHANHSPGHTEQGRQAGHAGKKAPPPPVVPILKKGTKGALAKKR
jgi:cytoskeletal protein CcmA (bactofilin family)